MKIIKLKQPIPRVKPFPTQPYSFCYSGFLPLPLPKGARSGLRKLSSVLKTRRSQRDFETPLTFQELASLVWHSARLKGKKYLENGTIWQSRIAPSAGGCHPIHIVIVGAPDFSRDVLVYDAEHNGFGVLGSVDVKLLRKTLKETDKCLRVLRGTVLWFFADLSKTGGKYHHPESLVWRDSGALLASIALVAEALGLRSCGLGIHETPSLRKILKLPASVIGVGGCITSK